MCILSECYVTEWENITRAFSKKMWNQNINQICSDPDPYPNLLYGYGYGYLKNIRIPTDTDTDGQHWQDVILFSEITQVLGVGL